MIGEFIQNALLDMQINYYGRKIKKEYEKVVSDNDDANINQQQSVDIEQETSTSEVSTEAHSQEATNDVSEVKVASNNKVEPVNAEENTSEFKGTESSAETIAIYSNEANAYCKDAKNPSDDVSEVKVASDQVPVINMEQQNQNTQHQVNNPAGDGWLKNDPSATTPIRKKPDPKAKADQATAEADTDLIKKNMGNLIKDSEGRKKNFTQKEIFNKVKNAFGKNENIILNTNAASKVAENNSELDFISGIEKIANSFGYKIEVKTQCWANSNMPTGMLEIITFNKDNAMVPDKSFTIDTGCIIDRRRKLIAGINMGNTCYEMMPIYEVKIKDPNSKKKVLDEQLIKSIFSGGLNSIHKREMYDPRLKELNRIVDLSTIGNCPSDIKHEITSRLENAYFNTSVFKDVLENNRGAAFRFRISSVNPTTHEFELSMDNGTCFFGIPNQGIIKKYSIRFKSNGTCEVTAL